MLKVVGQRVEGREGRRGVGLEAHAMFVFVYEKGQEYSVTVLNKDTEGYVIVDAMQVIALAP